MKEDTKNGIVSYLTMLADGFDNAERIGDGPDKPEGRVFIQVSDALVKDISRRLREIADQIKAGDA